MEVWKFGGAPEVKARAVASGDDETGKHGQRGETADCTDFEQIKGVLAHAGLPEWETQILGVLAHAF